MPLYHKADKTLLDTFIKNIEKENILRVQKKSMESVKYWSLLREIIEERAELFRSIFSFSRKDDIQCEAVAERYKRFANRKAKKRRAAWGIGIGAGAAAGAAAVWYISKKEKNKDFSGKVATKSA